MEREGLRRGWIEKDIAREGGKRWKKCIGKIKYYKL